MHVRMAPRPARAPILQEDSDIEQTEHNQHHPYRELHSHADPNWNRKVEHDLVTRLLLVREHPLTLSLIDANQ